MVKNAIVDAVGSAATTILDGVTNLIGKVIAAVENVKNLLVVVKDTVGLIAGNIIDGVKEAIGNMTEIFRTLFDKVVATIEWVASPIVDGISTVINFCIDKVLGAIDLVKGLLSNMLDVVKNIATEILEGLKSLFIPSKEYLQNVKSKIDEKFPIIGQVNDIVVDFAGYITGAKEPNWTITYKGVTVNVMDWTAFNMVRTFIQGVIIALAYYRFGEWLIRYIPTLIRGL